MQEILYRQVRDLWPNCSINDVVDLCCQYVLPFASLLESEKWGIDFWWDDETPPNGRSLYVTSPDVIYSTESLGSIEFYWSGRRYHDDLILRDFNNPLCVYPDTRLRRFDIYRFDDKDEPHAVWFDQYMVDFSLTLDTMKIVGKHAFTWTSDNSIAPFDDGRIWVWPIKAKIVFDPGLCVARDVEACEYRSQTR
jgi:hypothetical protein